MASLYWNAREGRPRAGWRLVFAVVAFLVIALLVGILGGFVLASWATAQSSSRQSPADGLQSMPSSLSSLPGMTVLTVVVPLLAALAMVWLAARYWDHRSFAAYGFHFRSRWWVDFGVGFALGALLMAGIFLVELAAGWLWVTGTWQTARPGESFFVALLVPIVTFVAVGIYEELLIRGYLLRNLAEGLNFGQAAPRRAVLLAWLGSAVFFGLLHATNPNASLVSTVNLMGAGIFLGLGYVLSGELALPIGLHMAWNFFQGNVFGFPVSGATFSQATVFAVQQQGPDVWTGGAFGPEGGLLGVAAMGAGCLLILLWVCVRGRRVALCASLAEYEGRSSISGGEPV